MQIITFVCLSYNTCPPSPAHLTRSIPSFPKPESTKMKENTFHDFINDLYFPKFRCFPSSLLDALLTWRPPTDHHWLMLLSCCLTFPVFLLFAISLVCFFHNWITLLSFCLEPGFLLFPPFFERLTSFWRLISIRRNSPMLLFWCFLLLFRLVSSLRFRLTNIPGRLLLNLSILRW